MRKFLLIVFLTLPVIALKAQNDSTWKMVLVNPDLKIDFPAVPKKTVLKDKEVFSLDTANYSFEISTEKTPLNYEGKKIHEVNHQYYSTLTQNILNEGDHNRKLVHEKDFKIDGFHVRELIYLDTLSGKPARVTLRILNVIGYKEACYKIKFTDFLMAEEHPQAAKRFFNSVDIYYKLEHGISEDSAEESKLFKGQEIKVTKKVKKRTPVEDTNIK